MRPELHETTCIIWGTYDLGKPRTRILISAANQVFGQVFEQHVSVWSGVEDKSQLKSVHARLSVLIKWILAYPFLIIRYLMAPRHSVVLVPYMGLLDVFVLYPFAKLRGATVCLDIFISIYDTTILDRRLFDRRGITARLLYRLERRALNLAKIKLIDTRAHARHVENIFGLPAETIHPIWVGVESEKFPRKALTASRADDSNRHFKVLFYGQFIPLHGIDVIVKAAELLERRGETLVDWILIGKGQQQREIDRMIHEKDLSSITRVNWVPYERLIEEIYSADVCLGVFKADGKSQRVISNKVFQILAAGTPLITADSPAMRELLPEGAEGVSLVPAGDPLVLADIVLEMSLSRKLGALDNTQMPVVDSAVIADQLREVFDQS